MPSMPIGIIPCNGSPGLRDLLPGFTIRIGHLTVDDWLLVRAAFNEVVSKRPQATCTRMHVSIRRHLTSCHLLQEH